jgi:hypothetical protein
LQRLASQAVDQRRPADAVFWSCENQYLHRDDRFRERAPPGPGAFHLRVYMVPGSRETAVKKTLLLRGFLRLSAGFSKAPKRGGRAL